ncbi:hypothetical protein EIN_152710 [Entamoeba invadens IP1]|uniref:Uncharacterized protein n=1 Tax=Entamoeba invadens IP1 TaxID=370355 RepID=A0A0A1U8P3_ENTIV|nr:hypothetical protein EIN_152710 [Entamoeba invadens IP1]ELP91274.1 hypothetical protein EIN_152710 [Entamoeba invadens IP1]|eukprot:XP_004258045.1 hypothetical protein EIN_152710 [Entamoeba invadens IP1]
MELDISIGMSCSSAFKPVLNYSHYEFFRGYERIETPTSFCQSSLQDDDLKSAQNKRWEMRQKVAAVRVAKKLGMSKAVAYLQKSNPTDYSKLSISTLKYWVEQSNGRKRRYYD